MRNTLAATLRPRLAAMGSGPTSGSWLRCTSTKQAGEQPATGSSVFTGTADVRTDKPEEQVATDANRHWLSGEDLGTLAEAALEGAVASDPNSLSDGGRAAGGGEDDACHPADPSCAAGEEPPRPDDFHDDGDRSTPPSAGFPA